MEQFQQDLLEYLFVSRMTDELMTQRSMAYAQLKGKPKDIVLTSWIEKLKHDIAILHDLEIRVGLPIFAELEKKHNVKFKFLAPGKLAPGTANGGGVSQTVQEPVKDSESVLRIEPKETASEIPEAVKAE